MRSPAFARAMSKVSTVMVVKKPSAGMLRFGP